jgi:hypothetical protein
MLRMQVFIKKILSTKNASMTFLKKDPIIISNYYSSASLYVNQKIRKKEKTTKIKFVI